LLLSFSKVSRTVDLYIALAREFFPERESCLDSEGGFNQGYGAAEVEELAPLYVESFQDMVRETAEREG